ncbi:MAG: NifB/NifX family molybdenum-iron cluster-binding protein [Bacteroidota bacterium]|nr:NifB/NifX family molybdenum-iron cluster-binding protein [Bacteroidota bacterium]
MKYSLKLAIALDKDLKLPESHFGESGKFLIYGLSENKLHFLKSIPNLHKNDDEETNHGDPVKGNNIANLLKNENVHILVSKFFGQNIKIVSQFFLPVIVPMTDVKNVVILLENNVSNLIEASTTHLKSPKSKAYKLK